MVEVVVIVVVEVFGLMPELTPDALSVGIVASTLLAEEAPI